MRHDLLFWTKRSRLEQAGGHKAALVLRGCSYAWFCVCWGAFINLFSRVELASAFPVTAVAVGIHCLKAGWGRVSILDGLASSQKDCCLVGDCRTLRLPYVHCFTVANDACCTLKYWFFHHLTLLRWSAVGLSSAGPALRCLTCFDPFCLCFYGFPPG